MRRYKKRIALYASSVNNRGGTGVYTRRLISGFKEAGITEVVPIGTGSSGFPAKLFAEHFSTPYKVRKYDLVHLPAFAGRPVAGVPYAVTVHDTAFMAGRGWFTPLKSLYYKLHFPKVAKGAAVVIADSDFTSSEIKKHFGLDSQRVYLSTPENHTDELFFRRAYGIDGQYLFSAGTIEPRKNMDSLLDAWPLIKKLHPELTLVVAGRWGWGRKETKHALLNTPGVKWVGCITENQLMSAYSGARLLIYPSVYEGFGLPPLESAASGTPFVIGPAEALREIYGGIAAAISSETSESISDAVLTALDKSFHSAELREFANQFQNRQMALNTYSAYEKAFK